MREVRFETMKNVVAQKLDLAEDSRLGMDVYSDYSEEYEYTYEKFKHMLPEEKARVMCFISLRDYDTVKRIVEINFINIGHKADIDEIM